MVPSAGPACATAPTRSRPGVDKVPAVTITRCYCGHLGCDPARMLIGWLRGASIPPHWAQLAGGEVVLTPSGRTAIALAAHAWGLGPGDKVLVPAYNCGAEIDPIASRGATLVPYRVDERAVIDYDDLIQRVTHRTRAVYVTHYFGWPQRLTELAAWCRQRQILLLEDCALALFSAGPDGPLGAHGDAVIFSFRKTLGVPDGGALVLRRGAVNPLPRRRAAQYRALLRPSLSLLRNSILEHADRLGCYPLAARLTGSTRRSRAAHGAVRGRRDIPARYYFNHSRASLRISRPSAGLLHSVDLDNVVARRRSNCTRLLQGITGLPGVIPLFDDVPAGVCPLSLPVRVADRALWRHELAARRIASIPWWSGYHRDLPWDALPEACVLKDQILGLPVHHDLTPANIDYLGHSVRTVARQLTVPRPGPPLAATPRSHRSPRPAAACS